MAHRTILTERQRSVLFDLPIDETAMLRHYILADDDLEIIRARRRPHNRFGFALQLCALRYPGRLLISVSVQTALALPAVQRQGRGRSLWARCGTQGRGWR